MSNMKKSNSESNKDKDLIFTFNERINVLAQQILKIKTNKS